MKQARRRLSPESAQYVPLRNEPDETQRGAQLHTLQVPDNERKGEKSDTLIRLSSLQLPSLKDIEKKFFGLVDTGDVDAVREFLRNNPDTDLNSTDFKGVSALHIAIKNHDAKMVEFLLETPNILIGDCVLCAVEENQISILSMILDKLAATDPKLEFMGCTDSVCFMMGTTPLILAAKSGHYEMIGMLLERGHTIEKPHHPQCSCTDCKEKTILLKGERTAKQLLNVYQALINPAYICQSSVDPILSAFVLNNELKACAAKDHVFREMYLELARKARTFAVELIDCCNSRQEMECILKLKAGCDYAGQVRLPRLMLAMDYSQKEFVAHCNTQEVLNEVWAGNWNEWRGRSEILKLLVILPRIVMLPYVALMCVFAPKSNAVAFHSLPLNKMINTVASYLIFLTLVFIVSNQDKKHQKRGPPNSGVEPAVIVYVAAYIWSSTKLCLKEGPRRFFSVLANWYDVLMEILFASAIFYWLCAYLDVQRNGGADVERKYWDSLDYTLVAEGLFAVATIFAFGRIMLLLQLNAFLGPIQVALGKMGKDIAKFFVMIGIIILAFNAGLCRFLQYYDGMIQENKAMGSKVQQVSSFVNVRMTLKTLFWGMFGMSPLESADVVIEDLVDKDNGTTFTNSHDFTQAVGHICFAVFSILIVFVVVNMMIAGLCNTMQKVIDNVHVEWTFGRTAVCINYINQTTLPPPFNLIPTAEGWSSIGTWCSALLKPTTGVKAKCSFTQCCYTEYDVEEDDKTAPALMATLFQRYMQGNKTQ